MRKRILDQPIDVISFDEAAFRIKAALFNSKQFKILTLNPEMIIEAEKNCEFQAAINNSHMIVPDGIGIVWALQKLNNVKNIERVPGIELARKTLDIANELKKSVALFGSSKGVLEACIKNLQSSYPLINFKNCFDGYGGINKDSEVAEKLREEKPDVILVGLGSPRQELWINKYSEYFPSTVMIGVGGSFDIWSGMKKRAPGWMIDLNIEWLYRISSEPKRISRILKSHPKFIQMVLATKQ